MNIKNIEILSYTIPLKEPVEAYAAGIMTGFGLVIVKITDENGNKISDPNDPSRYQIKYLENTAGTVLPSIGLQFEF